MAVGECRVKLIKRSNDLQLYRASIEQRKLRLADIIENNTAMSDTQELIYAEMTQMGVAELLLSNASDALKQRLQQASDWVGMLTAELHYSSSDAPQYEKKVEDQDRRLSVASTPSRNQERMDRLCKQLEGEKLQLKQEREAVKQEKEQDQELKKRWEHEMTEEKNRFRREKADLQMELQKISHEKEAVEAERSKMGSEMEHLRAEMEMVEKEATKSAEQNRNHVTQLKNMEASPSTYVDHLHLNLIDELRAASNKSVSPKEIMTRQQAALSTCVNIIRASCQKQSSNTEVASSDISLPATSQAASSEPIPLPKTASKPTIHINKKRGRPSNASKLALQKEKEMAESVSPSPVEEEDTNIKRKRRPKNVSPDEGYDHSNDGEYTPTQRS